MLLDFIYAVSLATLGISIPRHVSGNAVDFGPDFDFAPAKRTGIIDFCFRNMFIQSGIKDTYAPSTENTK